MNSDFEIETAGALIALRAVLAQLLANRFIEEQNPFAFSDGVRTVLQRQLHEGALTGADVNEDTKKRVAGVSIDHIGRLFDQVDHLLSLAAPVANSPAPH